MKVDAGKIVELVRKMKPLFADSGRVSQVKEKGTCDYVTQVDIQVQKLIKEGFITINNKQVKPNYMLVANDMLSLTFPRPSAPDIVPENIPIDIIYEDEDIIVVNKPKNMVVHPAPGHYQGTLVNALMYHCGDNLSGINGILRPGIVHRIDKDTTGR